MSSEYNELVKYWKDECNRVADFVENDTCRR